MREWHYEYPPDSAAEVISSPPESGGARGGLNRLMSLGYGYLSFTRAPVPTTI